MTETPLTNEDLPALFRAADRAAASSQAWYLRIFKIDLATIILGAIFTSWAATNVSFRGNLALAGAACFVVGLVLTVLLRATGLDGKWFGARAIAESVKTIAWRYMCGSDPFPISIAPQEADDRFGLEITNVIQERRSVGGVLGGIEASTQQITTRMRVIRSYALSTRLKCYLRDRIRNQRDWYARRSGSHAAASIRWLIAVGTAQLLGGIASIVLIRWPTLGFNAAPLLAALAAVFLAWLKVRQHKELANAYSIAAHELGLVEATAPHVKTETQLSTFVGNAEQAISREHTLWIARQDSVP